MLSACVLEYFGYCETLSAVLAFVLNGLLIVFVLRKTSTHLRNYSNVLLLNCASDLIFATTSALVKLVIVFIDYIGIYL